LGGGEVSPLDITSAYAVFANDGVRNPHFAIIRVEDSSNNIISEHSLSPVRVLPENTARQISDILADNTARTPLYRPRSLLYFENDSVASKTGTTNDYRDAWTVGYTPYLAVGAWAGNNDNSSMEKKISGLIITPLWRTFMDEALKEFQPENFTPPLPDNPDILKPVLRGELVETENQNGNVTQHSILYWINKDNPRGPTPLNPESDPQFEAWEYGVLRWSSTHSYQNNLTNPNTH